MITHLTGVVFLYKKT